VNGAGINASFAVYRDVTGRATVRHSNFQIFKGIPIPHLHFNSLDFCACTLC
jgi:hypothetical protein